MENSKNRLLAISLLVAAGLLAEEGARAYASELQDVQLEQLVDTLTTLAISGGNGSAASTHA